MLQFTEMTDKQVRKALVFEKQLKDKIKALENKVKLLEKENEQLKQYRKLV